jgi:hypothetical protein
VHVEIHIEHVIEHVIDNYYSCTRTSSLGPKGL